MFDEKMHDRKVFIRCQRLEIRLRVSIATNHLYLLQLYFPRLKARGPIGYLKFSAISKYYLHKPSYICVKLFMLTNPCLNSSINPSLDHVNFKVSIYKCLFFYK